MTNIAPISQSLQQKVLSKTADYIDLASQIYNIPFDCIPVNFKLTGRAAGMYHVQNNRRFIRYNPFIFAKYFDDNINNTVPHEVAHYIADMLYGIKNIRPHGREWKNIMQKLGTDARTYCNYDLSGIPQRQHRRFTYQCQCRSYEITTRRHNMILRGERLYQCPSCKNRLSFSGNLE